ncbi:MAG: rod shape-determining protein RodA [Bacteroidales bacterium]|nr:rod shape-determining protein RodA [Bacteroidales bacterium]
MLQGTDRGLRSSIDWTLIAVYLVLVLIGWLNVYASIHTPEISSPLDFSLRSGKQFVWILTSFALAAIILFAINPRLWEVLAAPGYLVVLVLLVAVIFLGTGHKGSNSWFSIGPVSFQPAEISKITTSLLLAMVMSRQAFSLSKWKDLRIVLLVLGLPMLVILAENETGSALVYTGMLFVLYREGLSGIFLVLLALAIVLFILTLKTSVWVSLAVLGVIALGYLLFMLRHTRPLSRERRSSLWLLLLASGLFAALVFSTDFAFNKVLQDHQRLRIEVLLGMKDDPTGVGYNVRQSMIAIGSGGFFGKGFTNGTQNTGGFVPEQSTDFIFCTVGEEWGFFGCLVVLVLYGFLILRRQRRRLAMSRRASRSGSPNRVPRRSQGPQTPRRPRTQADTSRRVRDRSLQAPRRRCASASRRRISRPSRSVRAPFPRDRRRR